ncbi:MAG: carboxypeptidase regulatory-like domain-containing protein [Xanthomonadales bacterium]|nr:carboxypeptidase regulatory-like domain-containing protein [Xanthomonadales bacterium]
MQGRAADRRFAPVLLALAIALALTSAPGFAAGSSSADANGGTTGNTDFNAGVDAGFDANYDPSYDPFTELGAPPTSDDDTATPYQDRIIAPEKLASLPVDDDEQNTSGAPRAAHIELVAHRSRFAGERSVELGAGFGGSWDTDAFGTLSAEALVFRSDHPRNGGEHWRGTATLWQRGLAMPGGWSVNNGLGVLNTPMPALLREQYRFFLPSVPMLGASSEWQQRASGLQLQAAVGRGGAYDGARLSGFDTGDGSVATVGAQWAWSKRWTGAASLLVTDGRIVPDDQGLPAFQNTATRALLFGNRWQGAHDSVAVHLQTSDTDAAQAAGAWIDARADRGRFTHRYGAFHLEPELAWGAWPINNDVRGGYYRLDFNRARWSWNAGIDRIDSISGNGFDGWYGNSFLRYQASARLGYGGGMSARDSRSDSADDSAQALQLFLDAQSRWGQTRLQYDRAHAQRNADSWQVLVDHALRMREGSRLSLSAGIGELANGQLRTSRTLSLAAYGGFDLTDDISLDGTIRWSHSQDNDASRGLDLNLGWRWRVASRWTLLGNLSESRSARRSPFALDPLTGQPVFGTLPHDRSVYVSLRYDYSAGRARQVLGGPPDAATGSIAGSVFLDDNNDGVRAASEQPAANITIVLDDRYSVRTDGQGRFVFERVAVGTHTLEAVPDNLPLPWSIDEERGRRNLQVDVRGETIVDIGAVRPR